MDATILSKIIDAVKDADLKLKVSQLVGENIQLKEENSQLKKQLEEQGRVQIIDTSLVHENNHYYLQDDAEKRHPYCTRCWDADKKLMRLHKGTLHQGLQYFSCPECKTETTTGEFIPQPKPDWANRKRSY